MDTDGKNSIQEAGGGKAISGQLSAVSENPDFNYETRERGRKMNRRSFHAKAQRAQR
jgi:hypothetical protein